MIYIYDNAIAKNLQESFNPDNANNPMVKVVDKEAAISLAAQIKNDEISLPIVVLTRNPDVQVDTDRTNFSRTHKGALSLIDPETNELYYERAIPIKLKYGLTIITSRVADTDELVRELLFKYSSMYFITVDLPYESNRKVRFGVTVDHSSEIERNSSVNEHYSEGKLYETIIPLVCDGCVLVSYTAAKVERVMYEMDMENLQSARPTVSSMTNAAKAAAQPYAPPNKGKYYPSEPYIKYDTTENWNANPGLMSEEGILYIYTDYLKDKEGRDIAGIKVGDGKAFLIDLPFTCEIWEDHIKDAVRHITQKEREFWNNKVRCYIDPKDPRHVIFTTE